MFLGEIIKVEEIQKKQREGEKLITKTLFCDAAKAANVYSSKSQKRVARYRAVLESASRLGAVFFAEG